MQNSYPVNALVYGLEEELAGQLCGALLSCCREVKTLSEKSKKQIGSADVIFCSADINQVKELKALSPDSSVIVASRFPEVSDWLDALEAGANDYCAAPFEPAQIRWVLESHVRSYSA